MNLPEAIKILNKNNYLIENLKSNMEYAVEVKKICQLFFKYVNSLAPDDDLAALFFDNNLKILNLSDSWENLIKIEQFMIPVPESYLCNDRKLYISIKRYNSSNLVARLSSIGSKQSVIVINTKYFLKNVKNTEYPENSNLAERFKIRLIDMINKNGKQLEEAIFHEYSHYMDICNTYLNRNKRLKPYTNKNSKYANEFNEYTEIKARIIEVIPTIIRYHNRGKLRNKSEINSFIKEFIDKHNWDVLLRSTKQKMLNNLYAIIELVKDNPQICKMKLPDAIEYLYNKVTG